MKNKLYRTSPNQELLIESLELAESFFARGKGLLGRKELASQAGLWIKPCNNIHTFFMKFNIDCVFVNKTLKVEKVVANIKPCRIVGPFWKSTSVFELPAGTIDKFKISVGDQLYVVN